MAEAWQFYRARDCKDENTRKPLLFAHVPDGGGKGSRTPDLFNAIEALYQLSYTPIGFKKTLCVEAGRSLPNFSGACKRILQTSKNRTDADNRPHYLQIYHKLLIICYRQLMKRL